MEIIKLNTTQQIIQRNLGYYNKQYNTGVAFLGGGVVLSIFGAALSQDSDSSGIGAPSTVLLTTGGILSIVGAIIMIDSHKYIGRIGKWKFEIGHIKN